MYLHKQYKFLRNCCHSFHYPPSLFDLIFRTLPRFSDISAISRRLSFTGGGNRVTPGGNHRPTASYWQLSHIPVLVESPSQFLTNCPRRDSNPHLRGERLQWSVQDDTGKLPNDLDHSATASPPLHLCMKYEVSRLRTFWVIILQESVEIWTDRLTDRQSDFYRAPTSMI